MTGPVHEAMDAEPGERALVTQQLQVAVRAVAGGQIGGRDTALGGGLRQRTGTTDGSRRGGRDDERLAGHGQHREGDAETDEQLSTEHPHASSPHPPPDPHGSDPQVVTFRFRRTGASSRLGSAGPDIANDTKTSHRDPATFS